MATTVMTAALCHLITHTQSHQCHYQTETCFLPLQNVSGEEDGHRSSQIIQTLLVTHEFSAIAEFQLL